MQACDLHPLKYSNKNFLFLRGPDGWNQFGVIFLSRDHTEGPSIIF